MPFQRKAVATEPVAGEIAREESFCVPAEIHQRTFEWQMNFENSQIFQNLILPGITREAST